jgi:hypothetical protein
LRKYGYASLLILHVIENAFGSAFIVNSIENLLVLSLPVIGNLIENFFVLPQRQYFAE